MAKRRCNCFVFALAAWLRWRSQGAVWGVRNSRHITGLHWMVFHRGRWIHYEPLTPKSMPQAAWHKLWYHGHIKRGD
jgi:hypothetical protein